GQFITNSDAVLTAGATSTGVGIALKQLGGIINSLIAAGGFNIGFDYTTGSELSNTSDQAKVNFSIDFSPRWTFKGEGGVAVGGTATTNNNPTGELEAQWDVSRNMDKSLVLNFFTRPTNFGVENFGGAGNIQSFGAGIIYKTSFDRISEIFEKKSEIQDLNMPEVDFGADPPSLFDLNEKSDTIRLELEKEENADSLFFKIDTAENKKVSRKLPVKERKKSL